MRETIRYYAPGFGLRRPHNPLSARERAILHGLQKGRCYLCGNPFAGRLDARLRPTEDHVRPRHPDTGVGGGDWHNRLLAHYSCNVKKDNRQPYPCELLLVEAIWLRIDQEVTSDDRTTPQVVDARGRARL